MKHSDNTFLQNIHKIVVESNNTLVTNMSTFWSNKAEDKSGKGGLSSTMRVDNTTASPYKDLHTAEAFNDHEMGERTGGNGSDDGSAVETAAGIVGTFHCIRQTANKMVNNENVEKFIMYLIVLNAIMMGIGTYDFVTENQEVSDIFDIIDMVFLIIFTVELGLQFIYQGLYIFKNGWLAFDFLIIVLSWASESFAVVRAFRIVRVTRIIKR